ncbi:MAG TPA: Gfo/Idh/MocA family oxidoreductase [Armatimonadota bacterium]|jgi:predicted dehydrogenase|nr:Gfo/Idh/MocA family oxidoreductase [Armatimonadota bacterium]
MMADDITRRGFMKAAGTVGIGAAIANASRALEAQAAASTEDDRKVRVGIVGGGFGAAFQWHLDPNCTVAAVSDLRPDRRERLMKVYSCEKSYESLEKLILDDSIDAVAVFTGAPDHVRHCVAVMDTGKHCMSAVPAAMDLEGCAELVAAKERNGVRYMMAETSHYRAQAMLMRQLYHDGAFGELLYSEVEYYHPARPGSKERDRLWFRDGKPTWRHGFPPMLYPTHCTDYVVGVTGERFTEVSCMGWGPTPEEDPQFVGNQYDNPFDTGIAMLRTDRGNICRCNRSRTLHAHGERAQWFGREMTAFMAGWAGQPFVVKRAGEADVKTTPDYLHLLPEPMRVGTGHGNSHTFITHEFNRAILEDREPSVDVYTAVAETAPGIVAHESALRGGELLKVPSFDPDPA